MIVSEKRDHFAPEINFELNASSERAHCGLQNDIYSIENGPSCPNLSSFKFSLRLISTPTRKYMNLNVEIQGITRAGSHTRNKELQGVVPLPCRVQLNASQFGLPFAGQIV